MTTAIILAGGSSERLGSLGKPKQFIEINGKPLINYALERFKAHPQINNIIIVTPEYWRQYITTDDKYISYAKPGNSRQESIFNSLQILKSFEDKCDHVIIHDAARPLITITDISDCLSAMDGYDGATPYIQVTDTVYQSKDGITISGRLNRDELFAGQTPECYNFEKYLKAHENIDLSLIRGSSELAVQAGMRIHLYPGNRQNFKITVKEDLDYFSYLMERGL